MKKIGLILIVVGSVLLTYAFFKDTTVYTGLGGSFSTVQNLGLMQQQQNTLFLGALIVIVGVLLFGFSLSNEGKNSINENLKFFANSNLISNSNSTKTSTSQLQTLSKVQKITLDEAVNKLIEMEYEISRRKDSPSFELVKNRTTYYLKNDDELIEYAMYKTRK
jgi:hypothetical protein